jgi:hypothetical protein
MAADPARTEYTLDQVPGDGRQVQDMIPGYAQPYFRYRLSGLLAWSLAGVALLAFGNDLGAATMGMGAIISGITSFFHPTVPKGSSETWSEAQLKAAVGPNNIIRSLTWFGAMLLGVGAILILKGHL